MRLSPALLSLALLWQSNPHPLPELRHFRYVREIAPPASSPRQCAVLDAAVYAHAAPDLTDVRLFSAAGEEVPYALTLSETQPASDAAAVLNSGTRAGHLVFDLEMPARPYSRVMLNLTGENFLATAKVTGLRTANQAGGTDLGAFTLFDLSGQHLGRSTALDLAEATFPYLHVDLAVAAASGYPAPQVAVSGAQIPPSRESQTVYTTLAETTTSRERSRETIASFELPAQVPVERVTFVPAAGDHVNFSRDVRVTATVPFDNGQQPEPSEQIEGTISRVEIRQGDRVIREARLSVPATLGINQHAAARVEVAIENGDDRPLQLASVRLEMRQRKLCFDAQPGPVRLLYGDPGLAAPIYDYSRTFNPAEPAQTVLLPAETPNPGFVAREEPSRSFTERHPEVLWLALLAVVGVLGIIAFRSARRV